MPRSRNRLRVEVNAHGQPFVETFIQQERCRDCGSRLPAGMLYPLEPEQRPEMWWAAETLFHKRDCAWVQSRAWTQKDETGHLIFTEPVWPGWVPATILALRQALGLSQRAFAAKVGTTVSSVSRWETSQVFPTRLAQSRFDALRKTLRLRRL
jgi:DNA-binding transcriptional regulator YiaG